jgi:hypothetical protein
MIYCEHCGLANRDGSLYCNACGRSLVPAGARPEDDEPLPSWLRDAAVGGYLWKGELLLPEWLSSVRPFRELYGAGAVVLPPPYNEAEAPPATDTDPAPASQADAEEITFLDVEDEEGPAESDLLLLDDLGLAPDAAADAAGSGAEAGIVNVGGAAEPEEGQQPEAAEWPAGGEELIVEVLGETLSDTEPEPLLDESGWPVPVLEAEPAPDEELVAVVSLDPGDETLLSGVIETAEPPEAEGDHSGDTPLAASEEAVLTQVAADTPADTPADDVAPLPPAEELDAPPEVPELLSAEIPESAGDGPSTEPVPGEAPAAARIEREDSPASQPPESSSRKAGRNRKKRRGGKKS